MTRIEQPVPRVSGHQTQGVSLGRVGRARPDHGRVELDWVETFLAVVDRGGFTAASSQVHRSQSRVSAHIAALERELGVQLIDRTRRPATLTPAGRVFAQHAREIIATVGSARAAVGVLRAMNEDSLPVLTTPCIGGSLFPGVHRDGVAPASPRPGRAGRARLARHRTTDAGRRVRARGAADRRAATSAGPAGAGAVAGADHGGAARRSSAGRRDGGPARHRPAVAVRSPAGRRRRIDDREIRHLADGGRTRPARRAANRRRHPRHPAGHGPRRRGHRPAERGRCSQQRHLRHRCRARSTSPI